MIAHPIAHLCGSSRRPGGGRIASPASAQLPLSGPIASPTDNPAALTREAFALPYGRAMVAEFVNVLMDGADPVCLRSRKIEPDPLVAARRRVRHKMERRASDDRARLIHQPARSTRRHSRKSAGVGAAGEIKRLEAEPDVKRYLMHRASAPARNPGSTTSSSSIERYALINRIKLEAHLADRDRRPGAHARRIRPRRSRPSWNSS